MSFTFNKTGTRKEVREAIAADPSMPDEIKGYITRGVNALTEGDAQISISAYGHLRGAAGDANDTTASITITELAKPADAS